MTASLSQAMAETEAGQVQLSAVLNILPVRAKIVGIEQA